MLIQAIFQKGQFKLLNRFYFYTFLTEFGGSFWIFLIPFYVSIGFSFQQIVILGFCGGLTYLLFEIPTGAISDLYGRKLSVIIGNFANGLLTIGLFFIRDFNLFAIILVLRIIFDTMTSGSDNSWAIDKVVKHQPLFRQNYFFVKKSISSSGFILGNIVLAFIFHFVKTDFAYIWLLIGIARIIAIIPLLFEPDIKHKQAVANVAHWKRIFRQSLIGMRFITRHRILSLIFIALIFFWIGDYVAYYGWGLQLTNNGINGILLALLSTLIGFVGLIMPFIMRSLPKKHSYLKYLTAVSAITTIFIFGYFLARCPLIVGLIYIIIGCLDQIYFPLEDLVINSYLDGKIRATVLSTQSALANLFKLFAGFVVFWLVGDITPENSALMILAGGIIFFVSPIVLICAVQLESKQIPKS